MADQAQKPKKQINEKQAEALRQYRETTLKDNKKPEPKPKKYKSAETKAKAKANLVMCTFTDPEVRAKAQRSRAEKYKALRSISEIAQDDRIERHEKNKTDPHHALYQTILKEALSGKQWAVDRYLSLFGELPSTKIESDCNITAVDELKKSMTAFNKKLSDET